MSNLREAVSLLSQLAELEHLVQCDMGHGWETIAAFNGHQAAAAYAEDCAIANRFGYRVRCIQGAVRLIQERKVR